ncbi:MAG: D-glycero-alpha-D-manno-heptose-1,7-bisphosphate 7-phosphatase [Chloroflexota bacterium]
MSGSGARRPVVFIDKDGTLIEDLPYNVDPARVRFAPGAREAVRMLGAAGLDLVVVTNQSGVARGYFDEADLARLGKHLGREVAALGGRLAGFYACPHLPEGSVEAFAIECTCRKPAPGLIQQAAEEIGADTRGSWFIGDTWMDVAAGAAAGCRTILVGPEHRDRPGHPPNVVPDAAVPDLLAAAHVILAASPSQNKVARPSPQAIEDRPGELAL